MGVDIADAPPRPSLIWTVSEYVVRPYGATTLFFIWDREPLPAYMYRAGLKDPNTKRRTTLPSRTRESDVPSAWGCTARPCCVPQSKPHVKIRIFWLLAASEVLLKQLST